MKGKLVTKIISFLSLFTSFGTLFCCALPVLFVSLGLGSTLLALTQNAPGVIWIGENKNIVFLISFILLSLNSIYIYSQKNQPCPIDPLLREACTRGRKWSFRFLVVSWIIFLIGFVFAFVLNYFSN